MDIIGQKFGKLLVIAKAERPGYVICECECGNVKEIRKYSLTKKNKPTRACGCEQRKRAGEIGKVTVIENAKKRIETNMKFHTNFGVIENPNPPKNNKTGQKGVSFNTKKGKYQVAIHVQGKTHFLGYFSDFNEAVKARKEGEKKFFAPLISQKKEYKNEV
jgi:hypothetical protein